MVFSLCQFVYFCKYDWEFFIGLIGKIDNNSSLFSIGFLDGEFVFDVFYLKFLTCKLLNKQ